MNQLFPAHGLARYEVEADLIRMEITGPWNKELVILVHQQLLKLIADHPMPRWGLLIEVKESCLCEPEALEMIRRGVQSGQVQAGRVATAWVITADVEGRSLMRDLLEKLYQGLTPLAFFEEVDCARQWLHHQVFSAGQHSA